MYRCQNCGDYGYVTIEYGENGKTYQHGRYDKILSKDRKIEFIGAKEINLEDVKVVYEQIPGEKEDIVL